MHLTNRSFKSGVKHVYNMCPENMTWYFFMGLFESWKTYGSGIHVIIQLKTHNAKHKMSDSTEFRPEHLEPCLLRPSGMCVSYQHAGTSMKILCRKAFDLVLRPIRKIINLLHHVDDHEVPDRSLGRATYDPTSVSLIMPVFGKGSCFHDVSVSSHRAWTVQRRVGEGQSAEVYSVRCEEEPSTQVGQNM